MNNKYSFCIVEPRYDPLVLLNIQNIRALYKEHILFYCGKDLKNIFEKKISDDSVQIIELEVSNFTTETHSDFFKSLNLWNSIQTDYVVTIQTDGCLCKNSKYKIEDFLHYDYVGGYAPQRWWKKELDIANIDANIYPNMCFNGGFTLRKVSAMKEAIKHFPPMLTQNFKNYNKQTVMENFQEDVYFVCALHKIGYNIGKDEHSLNFCTHSHFLKQTFCIHKARSYINKKQLNDLLEYCPEYKEFLKERGSLHTQ